jgi:hypothetical protein
LTPGTLVALETYLAERATRAGVPVEALAGPLLATRTGGRMNQGHLWELTAMVDQPFGHTRLEQHAEVERLGRGQRRDRHDGGRFRGTEEPLRCAGIVIDDPEVQGLHPEAAVVGITQRQQAQQMVLEHRVARRPEQHADPHRPPRGLRSRATVGPPEWHRPAPRDYLTQQLTSRRRPDLDREHGPELTPALADGYDNMIITSEESQTVSA